MIKEINKRLIYLYRLYGVDEIFKEYKSKGLDSKKKAFNKYYKHYCPGCREYHYYFPKAYK